MSALLRGKVTAYSKEDKTKGLVEVTVAVYDEDGATILARVEQSMSGVYWLPELGDIVEVEVPDTPGYEARIVHIHRKEGDQQTSSCWTEKNDIKQLKTRSGHIITLDDTKDAATVTVQTGGGLSAKLDDKAKTVTVKGTAEKPSLTLNMDKDTIALSAGKGFTIECGGAKLEIDSSGNIKITTNGKLDISAQNITAEAKMKLTAKGQQTEVSGGMTAKVSGQTKLDLTSSGVTEIKGSMVKIN